MSIQDLAVAAVAIAGAAMLARRLLRSLHPPAEGAPCPSCSSGVSACAKPSTHAPAPQQH